MSGAIGMELEEYIAAHYPKESIKKIAKKFNVKQVAVKKILEKSQKEKKEYHNCNAEKTSAIKHSSPASTRSVIHFLDIVIIFAVALTFRLVYHFQINMYPVLNIPMVDAVGYINWADQIVKSGNWLGDRIFFQAPGYPYFLAIVKSLFGMELQVIQIVQHVLGALMCVVVYLIGCNIFDRKSGLVGGVLAAGYGIMICYSGFAIKSCLESLLFCTFIFLLSLRTARSTWLWTVLAGVFLGLTGSVRESMILLTGFVLVWLIAIHWKEKRIWLRPVLFLFGVFMVLIPIGVRNYIVGGEFVLLTSQGGYVFYLGNHEQADGTYKPLLLDAANPATEQRYAKQLAEKEMGKTLTPSEVSHYWFGKATKFIRENPQRTVQLILRKAHFFWNAYEISDTESYYFYQRYSSLLKWLPFRFGLIAVFGILGMVLAWKNKRAWLLHFLIGGLFLTTIPFFVFARYRLPVIVPLFVISGYAIAALWDSFKLKEYTKLYIALPVILVAVAIVFAPFAIPDLKAADISTAYYNVGASYEKRSKRQEAIKNYQLAAQEFERNYLPRIRLMKISYAQRDFEQAEKWAVEILRIQSQNVPALLTLAKIFDEKGDKEKALAGYKAVVHYDPRNSEANARIAALK